MKEIPDIFTINNKEEILKKKRRLLKTRGIYFLIKNKEIVYIGSSDYIQQRIIAHNKKEKINFDYFSIKKYIMVTDEKLRLIEAEYILNYKPIYNKTIPKNNKYIPISKIKKQLGITKPKTKKLLKFFNLHLLSNNYVDAQKLNSCLEKDNKTKYPILSGTNENNICYNWVDKRYE